MALEIEHKFLLSSNEWKNHINNSTEYKQGYLVSDTDKSIRIRTSSIQAWLNIKSSTIGTYRDEYEYEIPLQEGLEILNNLCTKPFIEKTRHLVKHNDHTWEIDVFSGDNQGLIVAEIELKEIGEHFDKPDWIGTEVTEDLRYYNNNLCKNPFKCWQ